jgi:hypothetical protein
MNPQEQPDLAILHKAKQDIVNFHFNYAITLTQMSPDQLCCTGHKSIEAGVMYSLHSSIKQIGKLVKTHLQKYPD